MSIKISELPQAISVSSNDIVPIVQGGTTKRATKEMMFPTIASTIDSTSTNSEVAGAKAVYDYVNKPYGRWVLNDTILINPVSSYTQNLVKMVETITPDSNYFSYNSTTGVWTFNKAGYYRVKIQAQMRGTNSSGTTINTNQNIPVAKGFGIGDPENLAAAYSNCIQLADLSNYSNLYNEYVWTATVGSTFCAEAYARVMGGTIGTNKVGLWGYERTSIDIELIEETTTTSTNTLNTASLMNTGSLVGMVDRAELTSLALDNEQLEKVEEIEETKAEGSGDAR